jgi:uncharacterized membrane protein
MAIAYAVTYSVTYIETGSTKAAQSAGLSAALFMGNLWVIHSTVHMYQPHLINMLMTCKSSVG